MSNELAEREREVRSDALFPDNASPLLLLMMMMFCSSTRRMIDLCTWMMYQNDWSCAFLVLSNSERERETHTDNHFPEVLRVLNARGDYNDRVSIQENTWVGFIVSYSTNDGRRNCEFVLGDMAEKNEMSNWLVHNRRREERLPLLRFFYFTLGNE